MKLTTIIILLLISNFIKSQTINIIDSGFSNFQDTTYTSSTNYFNSSISPSNLILTKPFCGNINYYPTAPNYTAYCSIANTYTSPTQYDTLYFKYNVSISAPDCSVYTPLKFFIYYTANGQTATTTMTLGSAAIKTKILLYNQSLTNLKIDFVPSRNSPGINSGAGSFTININTFTVEGYQHEFVQNGINEYTNSYDFQIFPNPNNGDFNVAYKASKIKSNIDVFNIQGQLVYENTEERIVGDNNTKLNLKKLDKGVYFIKIGPSFKKIIIE
jgi:hypothetical protein